MNASAMANVSCLKHDISDKLVGPDKKAWHTKVEDTTENGRPGTKIFGVFGEGVQVRSVKWIDWGFV